MQEVVIPGFKGQAPSLISYAPVNASGYSTSEAIIFGDQTLAKIKETSAEMVTMSSLTAPLTPISGTRPAWLNNITSIFGYDQNVPLKSCLVDVALKTAADDLTLSRPEH